MKNFFSKCWKDIVYVLMILALTSCIVVLFATKQQKPENEIWGIVVETNSGTVKSYEVASQERYETVLNNEGMIPSGNLLKEIKIIEPEYHNQAYRAKTYKILLIEYDGDVTTLEYGWEQIYRIEYK